MFNGMMDPELMRIAQEQMNRMSPAELAKIQQQMMSNPDLLKMASESMKNMRPEDLRNAAEQLKYTRPEDMAQIGEKMASASPEEIASLRARADAQMSYELNAAEMLKKQGNMLHSQGKYYDASEKYLLAKKNLNGIPVAKSRSLLSACSLNLMSCYLKTKQYDDCIREGTEVLSYDITNIKALYRRGQAYKELGQLEDAVADLSKAHEISPDDDTIAEVWRDAKEKLIEQGGNCSRTSAGLVIEEITEDDETLSSQKYNKSSGFTVTQPQESSSTSLQDDAVTQMPSMNLECLDALKDDPNAMKSFQNFMSDVDPETLTKMGAGKIGEIPPDMLKTASNMISNMSPEELQNMVKMASSFERGNPFSNGASDPRFGPGSMPSDMTPEMIKTVGDMMSKVSPDELQKMFEMASSVKQRDAVSSASTSTSSVPHADYRPDISEAQENLSSVSNSGKRGTSSSSSFYSNQRGTSQSSFPASNADLQDQMRNQMKDPAMRQMFSSMMKNMSPDMMASMSEQFGMKLSKEDAEKAQQAMASFSPEDLDKMMRWADRIQRGVEGVKKTKSWLLGRSGMILAICMLILAVILHRLGFIGG